MVVGNNDDIYIYIFKGKQYKRHLATMMMMDPWWGIDMSVGNITSA